MNPLLVMALLLAGPGDVEVALKTERRPVHKPPKGIGNDYIETRLSLDNLKLWHRVAVDPHNDDTPARFGYGDYFFGCEFGRQGNGGWNIWNFTGASASDPQRGGKPIGLHRRAEGFHVVERGARAVADVVWWPAGGPDKHPDDFVTMRFIKEATERQWCSVETATESNAPLALASVWYSAFPANTTGPPARERWVTTPARSHNLMKGAAELDPAREWAISLHNKHADGRAGSLLLFEPDEVAKARVEGTYGVTLRLTPKPGRRRIHVAISYFLRQHYTEANAAFLRQAPQALARLRKTDWEASLEGLEAAWRREMDELAEPLRLARDELDLALKMDGVRADYDRALAQAKAHRGKGEPVPRRLQRQLCQALARLQAARDDIFAAAVRALLGEQKPVMDF